MTAIPAGIPILGAKAPINGDLSYVGVETGVNEKLIPTVQVVAQGEYEGRPVTLTGLLTVDELRAMALQWSDLATGVRHDAAVAQELVISAKQPPEVAVAFVDRLNARRQAKDVPAPSA